MLALMYKRATRLIRCPPTTTLLSRRRLQMSSPQQPANAHYSIDAEGKTVVDLNFASEALGMPATEGYGWAQFEFGERIGTTDRYTICRKLGWGIHSSTWLARDEQENKFVAVKALTGHMTNMYDRAVVWEADALRLLTYPPSSSHCVRLLDEFTIPGKGSAARTTHFPLPVAKRIVLHMLRGIAYAHGRGVVHTDLKPDNIFFDTDLTTEQIEDWIVRDPSRRHPPETSYDGIVCAAVSQPLPMISEEAAMRATYILADFGCAHPSNLHDDRTITTVLLRPPESFLGGSWDKPADIWSFGCLVYELVTAQHLFCYRVNKKFDLNETENILYQMILHTEEDFRAEQLSVCPLAPEFFSGDCQLKKKPTVINWPISACLRDSGTVPPEEVKAIADFIERCLHLDPNNRASAQELLNDPWFADVV